MYVMTHEVFSIWFLDVHLPEVVFGPAFFGELVLENIVLTLALYLFTSY